MKKNKKFIYLISPNSIDKHYFFKNLDMVLKSKKVSYFQLRLKKNNFNKIVSVGKKIKKICKKHKVKLILNDNPLAAYKIGADGCHIGQNDGTIKNARKILKNKIIGATCHNSKKLINKAISEGADYIAIGAFYPSNTKKIRFKATIKHLLMAKKISKVPIVAIGGINSENYKKLLLNKANFLAISSYIWNNKKLKPLEAIKLLK